MIQKRHLLNSNNKNNASIDNGFEKSEKAKLSTEDLSLMQLQESIIQEEQMKLKLKYKRNNSTNSEYWAASQIIDLKIRQSFLSS